MKSLKAIRVSMNLTQKEVADQAGISQPTYSNIENGERKPSVELAKRLAVVLGIDWTNFFDSTEQTDVQICCLENSDQLFGREAAS